MTDEYDTPVTVELSYGDWLSIYHLSHDGLDRAEEEGWATEKDKEAYENFKRNLERPEEVESPIEKYDLQNSLRKALAGRIPEIQMEIDDDTVYCRPCDKELDYTPSVLQVHNMRRHPGYDSE